MKFFQFPSSRDSRVVYTTVLNDNGVVTCDCPGYTKRSVRECKHTKQVIAENNVVRSDVDPTDFGRIEPVQQTFIEPMVGFVQPMLASPCADTPLEEVSDPKHYIMEEKFDGHRLIVRVDRVPTSQELYGEVAAWSRQGNERALNSRLRHELSMLPEGTYDGELIIPGGTSTDVTALDKLENAEFRVFDMLKVCGWSIMDLPYVRRREYLLTALQNQEIHSPVQAAAIYEVNHYTLTSIWARGGEGVIVKNVHSTYTPGARSKEWIKYKKLESAVLTVIGFEAGLLGPHSKIKLQHADGTEITVKTLNDHWRAVFATRSEEFIGVQLNIEHQGRTRDGKFRHPMADHFPGGEL